MSSTVLKDGWGQVVTVDARRLEVLKRVLATAPEAMREDRREGLRRERDALEALTAKDALVAPRVLEGGDGWLRTAYIPSVDPAQSEPYRRAAIALLSRIRAAGWRHGDFTPPNILWTGDDGGRGWSYAVDWQEAHRIGEPPVPGKHTLSDSAVLMRALSHWPRQGDDEPDPARIARRWLAILQVLGADRDHQLPLKGRPFVDLGCYRGEMVALAAAEGMDAYGMDVDAECIDWARHFWTPVRMGGHNVSFVHGDFSELALDWLNPMAASPVTVCLSVFPYLLQEANWDPKGPLCRQDAILWLHRVIHRSAVLFFETQLAGDGPGPDFLRSKRDVRAMLEDAGGHVQEIITIPVHGRPCERTMWAVTRD